MSGARKLLEEAEMQAGIWPTGMPGHVNFGTNGVDVAGELVDGVHRLDGSGWQFVIEGGRIVRGVREDLQAWWERDHVTHIDDGGG